MKKLFLVFLAMTLVVSADAQSATSSVGGAKTNPSGVSKASSKAPKFTIQGYVKNADTKAPTEYATVTVMDSLQPINASYTDDKGLFKVDVPQGSYQLKVTLLGYTGTEVPITVEKNIVCDTIYITEGVTADAAIVIGQLITTDIDKTTYNTAADPETVSLTALEMLRKVPMLTVDGEDNLRLNGQTNYKILVNGKSSTVMNSNYKDVLKSMPAGSIKNIEVITNPPAKYDAEGIGGIINIITERKSIDGFNGSVSAGVRRFGSWNANAYIAAAIGKFSISANYYVGQYNTVGGIQTTERENFNNPTMNFINSVGTGDGSQLNNGFNVEASYEIDTMNLITLSAEGYIGNGYMDGNIANEYLNSMLQPTVKYDNKTRQTYGYTSVSGSLDYQKTFKKKDETLTASYKFDYNGNPSSYENDIESILNYVTSHERADNHSFSSEHTAQIDYFNPITENHQVEVGGKFIARPNVSNSIHEIMEDGQWVLNDRRRNDLDYTQYIGSLYGSYQYKIKKFSAKVGFRAEYTVNEGLYKLAGNNNVSMFNRYFNVVPYVTVGFKPTEKDNLRLGYTQRLSRPSIWYLNPYWNDSDPINIRTGNPNLESEISNTFDLTYGRFDGIYNINARLAASFCNNSIEDVITKLPTGALLTVPENIGKVQRYRLSLNGGVQTIKGKLNFNLNLGGGYTIVDANNGSGLSNQGWAYSAFLSINSTPWKNGSVSAHAGYFYDGVGLQSESAGSYFTSFSVGHWFLNKTLRVSANVSDPFTKYQTYTNRMIDESFKQTMNYQRLGQSFGVSLQWRFGKTQAQVKKTNRSITNDDTKAGGGQQGGGQQ